MSDYKPRPIFFAWDDIAFRNDEDVEIMNQFQRWMYRTLLQRMFFITSRPYLPSDDLTLMRFAGCDDVELWNRNKATVLGRFTKFEVNGVEYLENIRVTREWDKLMAERDKFSNLADKRWEGQRKAAADAVASSSGYASASLVADATEGATAMQEKLREGKIREDKVSKEKAASLIPGQLGYYNPESDIVQDTKRITKRCAEAWQKIKGTKSAVCRALDLPAIKHDWESMCSNHPADLLVAAFELWASELGYRDNTQWPLSKFFNKAQEYMNKVEMLNGISREVNKEAETLTQVAAEVVQAAESKVVDDAAELIARRARQREESISQDEADIDETTRLLREAK